MNSQYSYPTDLSDAEWHRLAPLVPQPLPGGRPPKYERRAILDAIFYLLRAGCAWRLLPRDLPPWPLVYHYFRQWRRDGTWTRIHDRLRSDLRQKAGRERQPSAAIIDSQSVKTTNRGGTERGFDAGKKVSGRKRHILVDTLGLLLVVVVHSAGTQDRDGAKEVLAVLKHRFSRRRLIWADGIYTGGLIDWRSALRQRRKIRLEIVKRREDAVGFEVLPRRWVVERTFAWLSRYRRMSKDYEYLSKTSEAMVYVAMINLMVRRLAR